MEESENKTMNVLKKQLIDNKEKSSEQRVLFNFSLLILLTGFFLWYSSSGISYLLGGGDIEGRRLILQLFSGFLILISTVMIANLYMSGYSFGRKRDLNINNEEKKENLYIVSLLENINKSIEKGKLDSVLSVQEKKEILSKVSTTIESQLNESLLTKIEETYGNVIHNEKLSNKSTKLLTETVERLKLEVEKLQKKANINLVYGIGSTISAIFILIFILINAKAPTDATTITTVFYYISRLFLVLLVQGISIFFLRLYKATLNDIMYMNNEVTNYEAKRDALSLAFSTGEVKSSTKMLDQLANTERNFTLKKGETSIFNQRKTAEDDLVDNALLKELLSKLKNK